MWVAAAAEIYKTYTASQAKSGSSGLGALPSTGQDTSIFDTSGWNVATGGSRISGSTASSGAKTQSPTQTPTIQPLPQYIDGGNAATAGGVDMTTMLLLGGAALVLVVLVAKRK